MRDTFGGGGGRESVTGHFFIFLNSDFSCIGSKNLKSKVSLKTQFHFTNQRSKFLNHHLRLFKCGEYQKRAEKVSRIM